MHSLLARRFAVPSCRYIANNLWAMAFDRRAQGVEDRHRRGPQRREIGDAEVRQVVVHHIDQQRIERHRDVEVGERAVALEIGQRRRGGAHAGVAEIFGTERIDRERDVGDIAGRAVGPREAPGRGHGIAGNRDAGLRSRGERDRGVAKPSSSLVLHDWQDRTLYVLHKRLANGAFSYRMPFNENCRLKLVVA